MPRDPHFQKKLLTWFSAHQRDLPWRKTKNPYRILVSEIMLQQTQVDRVRPKYSAFLRRFPTLQLLAKARQASVVNLWSGLGYNRRARNLHQLAKMVVRDHAGTLPRTPAALRELPGIGPYTAAAVACFAFGAPVALVDVNVRRVLGRYTLGVHGPERISEKHLWTLAGEHVPPSRSVEWNSALMDFGALVCIARSPKCDACPMQKSCKAYPKILNTTTAQKTQKQRFLGSTRYWRGQIVSLLREQPKQRVRCVQLRRVFSERGLDNERFAHLIQNLEKDELIYQKDGIVRL